MTAVQKNNEVATSAATLSNACSSSMHVKMQVSGLLLFSSAVSLQSY